MKLYIVDAFTTQRFSGNQAGVALLTSEEPELTDAFCQALAAELKHSETAFVRPTGPDSFRLRYFTPEGEVDLCGHATIAAFTTLREAEGLAPGTYRASTLAGELSIQVSDQAVWMDMAPPVEGRGFSPEETAELYAAYGLSAADCPEGYAPMVVSTGLQDILLPVSSMAALEKAEQDERAVTVLSERYGVVGIHMFWPCLNEETAAHCRNFAPLYAIPEETATGTSNGALTYYLYRRGKIAAGAENRFVQGEKMGKPSEILSRLTEGPDGVKVQVGGRAVLALQAQLL
ncbi:PhzF family phenazine biosynthesis protein [Intestinimonas timonensis]|uniref:PhzF family phenazine biosynthesis protein n=1 Tax=Intestinimonas timonensis TaxID=1689270 RepID=UPI0023F18AB2|nr:PhzF family phenazine biosynthesis protein [Intestinimonas timonensis]